MKNHRFLWLRNRTTNIRKCEKARNIKEKRTIEMFSTVSRLHVALLSSPRDNLSRNRPLYNAACGDTVINLVFIWSLYPLRVFGEDIFMLI